MTPPVQQVWTFQLEGGPAFNLGQIAYNPPLNHNGRMTYWKFVGTEEEKDSLVTAMQAHKGLRVKVWTERVTQEQVKQQDRQMEMQRDGYVFRTPKCPACFFFDPDTESACGLQSWDRSMVQEALKMKAGFEAAMACPLAE